jgi:adenine-specific DNA-methyltransferase
MLMGRAESRSSFGGEGVALPAPGVVLERDLVALCVGLGARDVGGWSAEEEALCVGLSGPDGGLVAEFRRRLGAGEDPLGELFCRLRPAEERRSRGATYTPPGIVRAMVDWAEGHATPARVVDVGAGSGRFLVEAGRRFPGATLVGVELDPVAALLARAHLAAAGLAARSRVIAGDYRLAHGLMGPTGPDPGPTLYIGNPPYVRHHQIGARWKAWLAREAGMRGLVVSQLAGLHVHFFLATALQARAGDFGVFITAAEWLDVNYGRLVRELFLGELGGQALTVIEPTALPFPDAASTAVIARFAVGSRPASVSLGRAGTLEELRAAGPGVAVPRERLEAAPRWSGLTRPARAVPAGYIELGELCRVHRGQVTGNNRVWIAGPRAEGLPPTVLYPAVTRARELFAAGRELAESGPLKRVIDLPAELDGFDGPERQAIGRFLGWAEDLGVAGGYVASRRKPWWSVGLRVPAPILATYMARRPPAFVRNRAEARHINIAHGLYPREPLDEGVLLGLVAHLAASTSRDDGRTYAGGLTKFEPREMERLLVPRLELLRQGMPAGPGGPG